MAASTRRKRCGARPNAGSPGSWSKAAGAGRRLLKADLVDRLYWFRAPLVIGGDGMVRPAGAADLGLEALGEAPAFERISVE